VIHTEDLVLADRQVVEALSEARAAARECGPKVRTIVYVNHALRPPRQVVCVVFKPLAGGPSVPARSQVIPRRYN
jgi:hypothetical protein